MEPRVNDPSPKRITRSGGCLAMFRWQRSTIPETLSHNRAVSVELRRPLTSHLLEHLYKLMQYC